MWMVCLTLLMLPKSIWMIRTLMISSVSRFTDTAILASVSNFLRWECQLSLHTSCGFRKHVFDRHVLTQFVTDFRLHANHWPQMAIRVSSPPSLLEVKWWKLLGKEGIWVYVGLCYVVQYCSKTDGNRFLKVFHTSNIWGWLPKENYHIQK
jgi:hypothetical protein